MGLIAVQILKFIGIVFLVIFGIVIFLLFSILFVPVRYRMDIKRDAMLRINGKISWYLSVVKYTFVYDQSLDKEKWKTAFYLFGIPIKAKRTKTDDKACNTSASEHISELPPAEDSHALNRNKEQKRRKSQTLISRVIEKIRKIKYTITKFCDKMKKSIDKAGSIREFVLLESTRMALGTCTGSILYMIQKLAPRNVKGWIHFGMEDPADTGQLLGVLSAIYGFLPKRLILMPDFENQILECDLKIKGHLHSVTVVRHGIRMILDKNVQNTYKKIKNGF